MPSRRRSGILVLVSATILALTYVVLTRLGYVDRLAAELFPQSVGRTPLSSGDFPAGASAPVGDIASVPLRPTLIGFVPRGSAATLLLASGEGVFKTGYALDAHAMPFQKESDLREALKNGAEKGGVDMAAVSVDELVRWMPSLRDAAPRVELLLGRSRGQEALGAVGVSKLADLKGRRVAVDSQSPAYYFLLWCFARAGLSLHDVTLVDNASPAEAGTALREGRVDAAAGIAGDLEPAVKERGGTMLASTADAPHIIAAVLVSRGDFVARYPDAVRRVVRGLIDAASAVKKDPTAAARLLGDAAPYLGDPAEAINASPPASLKDNLAFFSLSGEAPVTYDELFRSAGELFVKIGKLPAVPSSDDSLDLSALKFVAQPTRP